METLVAFTVDVQNLVGTLRRKYKVLRMQIEAKTDVTALPTRGACYGGLVLGKVKSSERPYTERVGPADVQNVSGTLRRK